MMIFFKKLIKDASGVTAIEYGLIASLILVGSLISIQLTGVNLNLQGTFWHGRSQTEIISAGEICTILGISCWRQKLALILKIPAAQATDAEARVRLG
jgi:Flp pilus assembly pilin Flp